MLNRFTLDGRPTLIFRVTRRYRIGSGRNAIHCVKGESLDGRFETSARVVDVNFIPACMAGATEA